MQLPLQTPLPVIDKYLRMPQNHRKHLRYFCCTIKQQAQMKLAFKILGYF